MLCPRLAIIGFCFFCLVHLESVYRWRLSAIKIRLELESLDNTKFEFKKRFGSVFMKNHKFNLKFRLTHHLKLKLLRLKVLYKYILKFSTVVSSKRLPTVYTQTQIRVEFELKLKCKFKIVYYKDFIYSLNLRLSAVFSRIADQVYFLQ